MLNGNQLSRWGAISRSLRMEDTAPNSKVFFVGNNTLPNFADFTDDFRSPDNQGGTRIFTTLSALVSDANTVAGRGDVVYVLPGHAETISAVGGITLSESGLTIVGLGQGLLRPTFTLSATAASLNITGADVTIKNCVFVAAIDAITAMVTVNATDVSFINCEFDTNNATMGAILGLSIGGTTTSDRYIVSGCRFLGPATNSGTTTTAQIQYEQAVDGQILNSYFTGKMTQAILNVTGTVLRGVIDSNRFVIATGTKAISVASASTPFIVNNRINVPSGTAPIIAAAGFVIGNLYSAAAGVTAGAAATF